MGPNDIMAGFFSTDLFLVINERMVQKVISQEICEIFYEHH